MKCASTIFGRRLDTAVCAQVSIQQTQRILREHAPDKDRFTDKYNELKDKKWAPERQRIGRVQ